MSETNNDMPPNWEYMEEYHPPFLAALLLFPPMAPFFWQYHVRISEQAISLGYSYYFHHEIDRSMIVNAAVVEHMNGLTEWGGWGYRKNLSRETGYITKNGPGIRLTYKENKDSKETTIVFNCDNADKVAQLLNTPVVHAVVH